MSGNEIAERTDSVEITVNAKGDVAYKVKAYDGDVLSAAMKTAKAIRLVREDVEDFKRSEYKSPSG